ncbi:hypothetical protein ACH52_3107 [Eubacterium limosum]|nr:hypothetical protein ACH52_3107 [Eubacterium limosum]
MSDSIYYSSTDAGVAAIILSFLAAYFVIILVIGIVCYVFNSLSLYQMAKNRGIDSPWLAWIPIAKTYLMGKIINEKVAFGSWVIPYAHVFLPLLPFAGGLLSMIPFIGWLFPIAYAVYYYGALYRLYRMYKPENAVLFLVLSIIFAITQPFFLFSMRNNQEEEYLA